MPSPVGGHTKATRAAARAVGVVLLLAACAGPVDRPDTTSRQTERPPTTSPQADRPGNTSRQADRPGNTSRQGERLDDAIQQVLDAGPGRGSSDYRTPAPRLSQELAETVLTHLTRAEAAPAPDGVEVRQAVDEDGRPVQVVMENPDEGVTEGLGLYAVREGTGAPPGLVIEVPHPRADRGTEDLGPDLFAALDAQALFVAGAHRTAGDDTADVAHEPASAFAVVDREVVGHGTVVLQLHGFEEDQHPGYAQIVLSSGKSTPGAVVARLDEKLQDAGFETCVYDGEHCSELGATRNVEAAHARAVGATFVHLELAPELREPGDEQDALVEALAEALGQ